MLGASASMTTTTTTITTTTIPITNPLQYYFLSNGVYLHQYLLLFHAVTPFATFPSPYTSTPLPYLITFHASSTFVAILHLPHLSSLCHLLITFDTSTPFDAISSPFTPILPSPPSHHLTHQFSLRRHLITLHSRSPFVASLTFYTSPPFCHLLTTFYTSSPFAPVPPFQTRRVA